MEGRKEGIRERGREEGRKRERQGGRKEEGRKWKRNKYCEDKIKCGNKRSRASEEKLSGREWRKVGRSWGMKKMYRSWNIVNYFGCYLCLECDRFINESCS